MGALGRCLAALGLAGAAIGSCSDDSGTDGASDAASGGEGVIGGMGGEGIGPDGDICGPATGGSTGNGTDAPAGRLDGCFGPCPNGQCDSSDSFFEPGCAPLYPCAVDSNFPFCASNDPATYCLMTGETPNQLYWLVACDEGTASFELCALGCSAPDGEMYACL